MTVSWTGVVERFRPAASRAFPYLFIPALVLIFHWPALSGYFILDDWDLLGPRVAQEFLANPLSPFTSLMATATPHYAPVARLVYALLSLLFGTNPFPYHAFCIGVVMVSGVLLVRYLLALGVSRVPSLFAAAFFSIAVSHQQVPQWITLLNYTLAAVFILAGLVQWESWLTGKGGRRPLIFTFVFLALALLTHSLGVLLPVLMAFRALFARGAPGAPSPGQRFGAVAAGVGVMVILAGVPQFLFPRGGSNLTVNTDLPRLLKVVRDGFLTRTVPGFLGISDPSRTLPYTIPSLILAGATFLFLLAWCFHRRHRGLAAMGLLLAMVAWALPLVMIKGPEGVILRHRFYYFPDLGYALVLAALFDPPAAWFEARALRWLRFLPGAVFVLFLFQTWGNLPVERRPFQAQDELLREAATKYVRNIRGLLGATSCQVVTIRDTQILEGVPLQTIKEIGNYDLQFTDHARIHRFYFGHRPEVMSRVRFLPHRPEEDRPAPPDPCTIVVLGGAFYNPSGKVP